MLMIALLAFEGAGVLGALLYKSMGVARAMGPPDEIALIDAIPPDAPIDRYLERGGGHDTVQVWEAAARAIAARPDHPAAILTALSGTRHYEALCILSVEGIPPTSALAVGIRDAILAEARAIRQLPPNNMYREAEAHTAARVAERFTAHASTLYPALQELREASGRHELDRWLQRHRH